MGFRSEYVRRGHKAAKMAFERLRSAIKARHGHGAITRMEAALGFEKGWFRWHARPGAAMSFENILACLAWAGIHPHPFFSELFAENPEAGDDELLPRGERPPIVDLAGSAPEDAPRDWRALIQEADDARYESPFDALETLVQLAPSVPEAHQVHLLAVAGSCYRSLYSIPSAIGCLRAAHEINDDEWFTGNILQRLIYCLQPTDPQAALRFARKAQLIFSTLGDPVKVAETLVDQAITLGQMRHFARAEALFKQIAKKHNKNLNYRYLVASAQGMAECYASQHKAAKALQKLEEAAENLKENADTCNLRAHLYWSTGKLLKDGDRLLLAIETFGAAHFFEAACVALDYCELLLEQDRPISARNLAVSITQLARQLNDNVIARMFENILAQITMKRKVNWTARRATVYKRRERYYSSLLQRL